MSADEKLDVKTYSIRKRYINKYTKPWRKNFTVGKGYIKIIKNNEEQL